MIKGKKALVKNTFLPKLLINKSALEYNIQLIKNKTEHKCKILGICKANAYGHGLESLIDVLSLCDGLGVARLNEAILLRNKGYHRKIVLLSELINQDNLLLAARYQLDIVIYSMSQLYLLDDVTVDYQYVVWLKVDTGMTRLGVSVEDFKGIYDKLMHHAKVKQVILMSHFADSELAYVGNSHLQLQLFKNITDNFENEKSIANSGGLMLNQNSFFDWVRPGISLFGVLGTSYMTRVQLGLKQVMTLIAYVIKIQKVKVGQSVGYNHLWIANKDTLIAIINIGYADGYPAQVNSDTKVLINDRFYPIVGRISMNMLTIDLSDNPHGVQVEDTVILWGEKLPIELISEQSGNHVYHLLTNISGKGQTVYYRVNHSDSIELSSV